MKILPSLGKIFYSLKYIWKTNLEHKTLVRYVGALSGGFDLRPVPIALAHYFKRYGSFCDGNSRK